VRRIPIESISKQHNVLCAGFKVRWINQPCTSASWPQLRPADFSRGFQPTVGRRTDPRDASDARTPPSLTRRGILLPSRGLKPTATFEAPLTRRLAEQVQLLLIFWRELA
jgi:hypothetical protein